MVTAIYPLKYQILLRDPATYEGPELRLREEVSSNLVMQIATACANQVKQVNLGSFCSDRTIDLEVFRVFVKTCVNCEVVDFSYCETLNGKDLSKIAEICNENSSTKIQQFILRSLPLISEQDLFSLNQVSTLKKITLQQNVRIAQIKNSSQFNFEVILLPTAGYDG